MPRIASSLLALFSLFIAAGCDGAQLSAPSSTHPHGGDPDASAPTADSRLPTVGRFVFATGAPAAGVSVELHLADQSTVSATSDDTGSWRVDGLTENQQEGITYEYSFTAVLPPPCWEGSITYRRPQLEADAGVIDYGTVTLNGWGTVVGSITSADGVQVPSASVVIDGRVLNPPVSCSAGGPPPAGAGPYAPATSYSVSAPAGTRHLMVLATTPDGGPAADGGRYWSVETDVDVPWAGTIRVDLQLPPLG